MHFMKHIVFACFLCYQVYVIKSFSDLRDIVNLVIDFVLTLKTPTKVSFRVCWSRTDRILFAQYLNKYLINFEQANSFKHYGSSRVSKIDKLFLLDLRCQGYVNFLQQANSQHLFTHPYRWIVLVNDVKDIPRNLNTMMDSQFYVVRNVFSNIYTIHALYKITCNSDKFLVNDVAIWNPKSRFNYFQHLSIVNNRRNLMKTHINISIVITNQDSLNHLWDYRDRHIDSVTKANYLYHHHVMDFLNASHHFLIRNTWGYRNESTNKYDGMIGDLQSGLAEIGGSPAFILVERLSVVNYLAPTTATRCVFVFRAPSLSHVTNILTSPFDTAVWYCCLLLVVIIAIVVYIILFFEWKYYGYQDTLQNYNYLIRPKFVDVLVMELGAICQQGSETEPRSTSGRIATIFIFVAVLFMYTFYSANIVVLMQSTSESIKTVEDLLNSRIKLGAENTVYNDFFFKMQTDPTRKAIYTQKMTSEGNELNVFDPIIGIKKMKNQFFAFHTERAIAYKIIADTFEESEKCRLREIIHISEMGEPWLSMKKNSSYKEIIKTAFRKLHENGIQNREFRKIYHNKKPVCESKSTSVTDIGLTECYYAFLIFGIGCLLAIFLLLLEIVIGRNFWRNNLAKE